MFRWYWASFIAHTDASVQRSAATDGSPTTAAASARGAPWSHCTASAAGSATDARLSGPASSWWHASCEAAATDWSTDASTKKTIEPVGLHRAGKTSQSCLSSIGMAGKHRAGQVLLGNTTELAGVHR